MTREAFASANFTYVTQHFFRLWEVHNEISLKVIRRNNKMIREIGVRIRKNTRRNGNEVQALWPDIQKCLLCFEDEGRWDEARVFQYLEKTYW